MLDTGDRELVNSYSDATPANLFWGDVDGKGENQLGQILSALRTELTEGGAVEKWLRAALNLPFDSPKLCVAMAVKHDGAVFQLPKKCYWLVGRSANCDFRLQSEQCAEYQCILAFDTKRGVLLVNLSDNGLVSYA